MKLHEVKKIKMDLQLFADPSELFQKSEGPVIATGQTDGMLDPEQAETFIEMIFDDSTFLGKFKREVRKATKGKIEKLGIGRRNLRAMEENTDKISGKGVKPILGSVKYSTTDVVLGAEVSNKFIRENIEKEGFEDKFMGQIAKSIQADILDGNFNWDTATPVSNPDYNFLHFEDGILKMVKQKGLVLDASTLNSGAYTDDMFLEALEMVPAKYMDPAKYYWIGNHKTSLQFKRYLKKRMTNAGDQAILGGIKMKPQDIEWGYVPTFPDGKILLANPEHFVNVFTYDMGIRKTTEGKEALFNDMRYYACHFDLDIIMMEDDSCVLIENIPQVAK